MGDTDHWNHVYATKPLDELSWFTTTNEFSLRLLERYADPRQPLVDVGAGASVLLDALLERGWSHLSGLDISSEALTLAKQRIGPRGDRINWIAEDVTEWNPTYRYGSWHDRAVLHFLVDIDARKRYVTTAANAISPRGVAVIGTFASDGPESCSGLPTVGYEPEQLSELFSRSFDLIDSSHEHHVTPNGISQSFTWVVLRRRDDVL